LDEAIPSDEQELEENFLSWDMLLGFVSESLSCETKSQFSIEMFFLTTLFMGIPFAAPRMEAFLVV
jgi:hypothetical protein